MNHRFPILCKILLSALKASLFVPVCASFPLRRLQPGLMEAGLGQEPPGGPQAGVTAPHLLLGALTQKVGSRLSTSSVSGARRPRGLQAVLAELGGRVPGALWSCAGAGPAERSLCVSASCCRDAPVPLSLSTLPWGGGTAGTFHRPRVPVGRWRHLVGTA